MAQRITKAGLLPDQQAYRLRDGREATMEVVLAEEPTDNSFPMLVRGWTTDADASQVELPGNVHTLHPDQIASGDLDLDVWVAAQRDAAAERMERYVVAVERARGMRRARGAA